MAQLPSEYDEVIDLRRRGFTIKEISEKVGYHPKYVAHLLQGGA